MGPADPAAETDRGRRLVAVLLAASVAAVVPSHGAGRGWRSPSSRRSSSASRPGQRARAADRLAGADRGATQRPSVDRRGGQPEALPDPLRADLPGAQTVVAGGATVAITAVLLAPYLLYDLTNYVTTAGGCAAGVAAGLRAGGGRGNSCRPVAGADPARLAGVERGGGAGPAALVPMRRDLGHGRRATTTRRAGRKSHTPRHRTPRSLAGQSRCHPAPRCTVGRALRR